MKQNNSVFNMYLICNHISSDSECKTENRTANVSTDSQWSKHEASFAHANQVCFDVNHNTVSLLANEFDVEANFTGK